MDSNMHYTAASVPLQSPPSKTNQILAKNFRSGIVPVVGTN